MRSSRRTDQAADPLGIESEETPFLTRQLQSLVPRSVAVRALSVSISTDRSTYRPGESVPFTVTIANGIPLPISVPIEGHRPWGWTVDGLVEASDEPRRVSADTGSLSLRGFETLEYERTWDGRFKRSGSPTRWVEAESGEYDLGVFVPTAGTPTRDSKTIELVNERAPSER